VGRLSTRRNGERGPQTKGTKGERVQNASEVRLFPWLGYRNFLLHAKSRGSPFFFFFFLFFFLARVQHQTPLIAAFRARGIGYPKRLNGIPAVGESESRIE